MSLRPARLRAGDRLIVQSPQGGEYAATFVERLPADGTRAAMNVLTAPTFEGLTGPDDPGRVELTDDQLITQARYA